MKVLLFGATGMVGQGVLRECLLDPQVQTVQTVGRTATGNPDEKLREIVHGDLTQCAEIESDLAGFDACFFCLGVSSAGMKEEDYDRVTYGLTMAVAVALCRVNPRIKFVYVSGAGSDSTEHGKTMWARVKGKTENDLLRLPFTAYMFRPGFIEPLHGEKPKASFYRFFYGFAALLMPLLRRLFPQQVLTTEEVGRAMLTVATQGYRKKILEIADIRAAALSNAPSTHLS